MKETVTLRGPSGSTVDVDIETLPGKDTWGTDQLQTLQWNAESEMVELLEHVEYEFVLGDVEFKRIEPAEVFSFSTKGNYGRIAPHGRAGKIRIDLYDKADNLYSGELEVRSRKLNYRDEYRWMIDRIANEATELALSPFAASRLSALSADFSSSPETLYCLLYTSPSPRDRTRSRMPSSA